MLMHGKDAAIIKGLVCGYLRVLAENKLRVTLELPWTLHTRLECIVQALWEQCVLVLKAVEDKKETTLKYVL